MASAETVAAFEELQKKHNAMINAGVQAAEAWISTPPEQRVADHDKDPDFLSASQEYEIARAQFDHPSEFTEAQ